MYSYTLTNLIFRTNDGAFIPPDSNNKDYQDFLAWEALGNTPIAAPPDNTYAWNGTAWSRSPAVAKLDVLNNAILAGYDTGLGWKLPLNDSARGLITSGAALIVSVISSYNLTNNVAALTAFLASSYTFLDTTNTSRSVTIQQAISINIGYGQYYQQIWAAAQ